MNMRRRFLGRSGVALIALTTLLPCSRPARAEEGIPPEMETSIRRLIDLTGGAKLGTQILTQMFEPMKTALPAVPEEFWTRFLAKVKPDDIVSMNVPIYARHFSHAEIREMIAFYESPTGRKFAAELPAVVRESMDAGQEWGKKIGEQVAAELRAEGYLAQ